MRSRTTSSTALTHWFTWRHVRFKVVEKSGYLGDCDTLLEVTVIAPRDTPVPLTSTGFLAHFIATAALTDAGGPVAFFRDWLDREARTRSYQQAEFLWRQGDLLHRLELTDEEERRP